MTASDASAPRIENGGNLCVDIRSGIDFFSLLEDMPIKLLRISPLVYLLVIAAQFSQFSQGSGPSEPYIILVVLDFVVRKYGTTTGNTRSFYFVVSHLTLLRFTT